MANNIKQGVFALQGGLDLVTPAVVLDPGKALIAVNYELPPQGGYRSMQGYERYDGRALASTGSDAAAQAVLRALIQPVPGSGNTLGVWWYNSVVYAFRNNIGGSAAVMYRATSAGWEAVTGPTLAASGSYQFQNYNFYGQSTSLRCYGVDGKNPPFEFGGVFNIATTFRDGANVATITTTSAHNLRVGDTVYIYNCATSGFNASAQTVTTIPSTTSFTYANVGTAQGTTADIAGRVNVFAQINTGMGGGQISTATRSRAANVVTISTATPHNLVTGNLIQVTGCGDSTFNTTSTACTVTSASTFTYANTGSNVSSTVDAAGKVYVATTNAPSWIQAHAKVLFLAYPGGSMQFSAAGDPKNWSVIYQAGEIGVGSNISGLVSFKGQYLVIGTDRGISTLTGTGPSTWALIEFSSTMGAIAGGMAEIGGQAHFMNSLGLSSMQTAMVFGDFQSAIQSQAIEPFYFSSLSSLRFTVVSRKKTQMRTFYSNGAVLVSHFGVTANSTPGQTMPQFTTMVLPTNFVCGGNAGVSDDQIYLGDDQGYVYRMDSGTSFDGAAINCVLRLAFNQFQSPMNKKRFHRVELQLVTPQVITLRFSPDFDYSNSSEPTPATYTFNTTSGGLNYWDQVNWDNFYWSDSSVGKATANVDGSGRNMGIVINSSETLTQPYTIQSALISYEIRGIQR